MENTNKMKNLTNDLKAFEQMMKEQRKENSYPEFEFEIDTEEDSLARSLPRRGLRASLGRRHEAADGRRRCRPHRHHPGTASFRSVRLIGRPSGKGMQA